MSTGAAARPFIPPALADQLRESLGFDLSTAEMTVGGFSHLSFVVDDAAGRRVVVKAATDARRREDLRREAGVLRAWADSLDPPSWVPTLVVLIDDGPDPRTEPSSAEGSSEERFVTRVGRSRWTAVVTERIEGVCGPALLATRPTDLDERFARLGRLLGVVHRAVAAPSVLSVPDVDLGCRWAAVADELERRSRHADASEQVTLGALIAAASGTRAGRGVTLVHGDAGLHNTIWPSPKHPVLIDWEGAGLGSPIVDLAWAAWTTHFRSLAGCADALLDGYGRLALRGLGWSADLVVEAVRAQMAALALKAFDSRLRSEWLSRADALGGWDVPG